MENQNKLYRQSHIRDIALKNGDVIHYERFEYYMRYGVADETRKTITDWESLLQEMGYTEDFKGKIGRKRRVWCNIDYTDKQYNRCQRKLYKDEFSSAEIYSETVNFELKNVRTDTIFKELSVEDFILLLKDNQINHIPKFTR